VIVLLTPTGYSGPRDLAGRRIAVSSAAARVSLEAALARYEVRAGRIEEAGPQSISRLVVGEADAAMLVVTFAMRLEDLPPLPVPGFAMLQIPLEPPTGGRSSVGPAFPALPARTDGPSDPGHSASAFRP
jgi:hypothetical protein